MELNQIKEYSHKVQTIQLTNKNKYSLYQYVLVKINISSLDDEVIRFSIQPNDEFIEHQQINDDYYCYVPNKLNQISILYAHFFPNDLYEYETLDSLVTEYDLKELIDSATITSHNYEEKINDEGSLIVQSRNNTSVTNYNDPNYKQYDKVIPTINQTQQGQFPLSSRYRSKQNWNAPNLQDINPQWNETDTEDPYWQARIPFEDLNAPINVFINYEYLPTSREYHQHYFGFEPTDMNNERNQRNTINVFEGTNINMLDDKFGSKNNYRLISLANKYDDTYSIYVPHENIIPINLEQFIEKYYDNKQSCSWEHHKCKDYYVYTPHNVDNNIGYCYKEIDLTAGHYYSLQYYIYIPSQATVSADSCYIIVKADDIEYKIDSAFISKDKALRDQWIYHEVPFCAGETNILKIIGPQGSEKENHYDDSIFFIYLELREMVQYSPTLQYGKTGLRITEEGQSILKPSVNEMKTPIIPKVPITPDNKPYTSIVKEFPKPYSNVNIISQNEKYIYYDSYTTDLVYVSNEDDQAIYYEDGKIHIDGNEDISFRYDNNGNLYTTSNKKIIGVYGPNNKFIFDFIDSNGDLVTDGKVEISILMSKDENINNKGFRITRESIPVTGSMTFDNIDLTYLEENTSLPNETNKYYIRLIYTNSCLEKAKIVFKSLYIYEEKARINKVRINDEILTLNKTVVNDITSDSNDDLIAHYIDINDIDEDNLVTDVSLDNDDLSITQNTYSSNANIDDVVKHLYLNDYKNLVIDKADEKMADYHITDINQFPLKVEVQITDQNGQIKTNGYCELSINDRLNQTTLVDSTGWADFYLTRDDFEIGYQTIKIEFYRQYNRALAFIFFDIIVDDIKELKNIIPIDIKILEDGFTKPIINNTFTINSDDCVLSTINTHQHNKFRISIYRNNVLILQKNIFDDATYNFDFIHATWEEWQQHNSYTFKIITGNMLDSNGKVIQDLYRDYERSFTIQKSPT